MPASLIHRLRIATPAEMIYRAITGFIRFNALRLKVAGSCEEKINL